MSFVILLASAGDSDDHKPSPENLAKFNELTLLIIRDVPPTGYEIMEKVGRLWPDMPQSFAYRITQRAKQMVATLQENKTEGVEARRKFVQDILTQKPSSN